MKPLFHFMLAGTLLTAAVPAAIAGSRAGGTGSGAVTIPAETIAAGGASSGGGTGTSAVSVVSSIGGIGGTVAAGTGTGAVSNRQGYIPQILGPSLTPYDIWAASNIPAGQDASFTGDANRDGVLNGVAYVFGNTVIEVTSATAQGVAHLPAPPSIPPDVNVYLEWSAFDVGQPLADWETIITWENGAAPSFRYPEFTSIVNGEVIDDVGFTGNIPAFYRYRVTQR